MTELSATNALAIIEPVTIDDIYVSDLCGIEDAGDGNLRFIFGSRQVSTYDGVSVELVVKARIVAGPSIILLTIRRTLRHLGMHCCGAVRGWTH